MSTLPVKKPQTSKNPAPKKGDTKARPTSQPQPPCVTEEAKAPKRAYAPQVARVTKQERMLALLSRAEGVSIAEMMQATNWQQHSVRGFLAGTVKKKLGFSLNSLESGRRCASLPHQDASRSLT